MKHLTTMEAAANLLLDRLDRGEDVSLEVSTEDASTTGLMRLIMEIHDLARQRRQGIAINRVGERTIRLITPRHEMLTRVCAHPWQNPPRGRGFRQRIPWQDDVDAVLQNQSWEIASRSSAILTRPVPPLTAHPCQACWLIRTSGERVRRPRREGMPPRIPRTAVGRPHLKCG